MKNSKWIPSIGIILVVCTLFLTLDGCATFMEGQQDQGSRRAGVEEGVTPEATVPVTKTEPNGQNDVIVTVADFAVSNDFPRKEAGA